MKNWNYRIIALLLVGLQCPTQTSCLPGSGFKGLEEKLCEDRLRSLGLFRLEETAGSPHCSHNFLWGEGRGGTGTDLCSVLTVTAPQGMAWSWVRRGLEWTLGEGSSPRVFGHWNSSPGKRSQHQPGRVQEAFGQCCQAQGVTLGSGPVPGVGFDDPWGSLPTQCILWFFE